MDIEKNKTTSYKKNDNLEHLLSELNSLLELISLENKALTEKPKYPIIFIVGTPRSGTTLLTQWLASLNLFTYPTNFISRFHKLPYVGSLIQEMLFNKDYQYKNELNIEISSTNFSSDVGKTIGALEPHEFWYFWRNYFKFPDIPVTNDEFIKNADFKGFENQISLIQNFYNKPFFLKSLIMNWYIESFNKHIDNALFIYIKRNPVDNVKSLLNIRRKYLGDDNLWFSFKPKEYNFLKNCDKITQVAGQVYYTNKEIETQLDLVNENRKLIIDYETFCSNPELIYLQLKQKLANLNITIPNKYIGITSFDLSQKTSGVEIEIETALNNIKTNIINIKK